MAEDNETGSGKKRRIIHWNPDAGQAPATRRWSWRSIVLWTVGGFFGLLFAAGAVVRLTKLVFGPEVFEARAASDVTAGPENPRAVFVSQSKAELARETASKSLAEIRRMPADHPVQFQKLVLIEKAFIGGDSLLQSQEYGKAYAHFEAVNREIDEFSRSVKAKHDAQQAYDTILLKRRELERARSLAGDALNAADEAAGAGWRFLNDGSFIAAKTTFDEGLAQLKRAEEALQRFVEENILRGQQALATGQREAATQAFTAALEKAAGNEVALQGLKRAETIDRVYAQLQQGASLEKEGQYLQAADAYQKAFALDPFSAVAQEGQSRANRLHKETQFNTAFNAAKEAFERKDWTVAISEYEKALKVYPARTDVQQSLKDTRERAHKDAVQRSLAKAFDYENKYMWKEARAAYYDTLNLEKELADAKEGYARAGRVIRALLQFESLVEVAEERASRAEFQAAIRTFNEAMAVKPDYLPLSDKAQQLRALLMSQNDPVDVTFNSDGKTWVSISNFRNLERFRTTTVKILPGDYEIIGRRKGYQDVLLLLQVRSGSAVPTVTVACNISARG